MQELIGTLFQCAAGQNEWQRALDLACHELGVTAATLIRFDDTVSRTVSFEYSSYFRQRPTLTEGLEGGSDDVDPDNYRLLFRLPPQQFFSENDANKLILGRTSPEYAFKDELRANGLIDRAAATLNITGPSVDFIAMQVSNSAQMRALTSSTNGSVFAACLAGAVSSARIFASLRARYNAALRALDRLGLGVALVLSDGSVISFNAEAQRIADLKDGIFRDRRGILRFADADLDGALRAALASCHVTGRNRLLSVPKRSGDFAYLASIQPIEDSAGELEKGLRCAFFLLVDPSGPNRLEGKGLAALGGLSESETDVLDQLLLGKSVAEISQLRDTSVATTRTHLRAILEKLRCRHQQDLIRLAAETKLPLTD